MEVRGILIDNIGLSVRALNALHRANVQTVGEMLNYTEDTLYEIKNLGKKTVEEILDKINYYNSVNSELQNVEISKQEQNFKQSSDFEELIQSHNGRNFVLNWLKELKIDELDLLSAKAYNILMLSGYINLKDIIFLDNKELCKISRMDIDTAREIERLCKHYLLSKKDDIISDFENEQSKIQIKSISICELINIPEYRKKVITYVKNNDCNVEMMGISIRAKNHLMKNKFYKMSDIIFVSKIQLQSLKGMGKSSVDEIVEYINKYLLENQNRIYAFLQGDISAIFDKDFINQKILELFNDIEFKGLNLSDIIERLKLPQEVTIEKIKQCIGSLIASNKLEYVDYRCYRIYPKFEQYVKECQKIDDRSKDIIQQRLNGYTLEIIAQKYNLTRERVRQILNKNVNKVIDFYKSETGMSHFDEDYYRYFYENYEFEKKDAEEWFGIPNYIWSYLDLINVKQGKNNLENALDDRYSLDLGLRLKIKNYLNRDKLYLDGIWINKNRTELENYVVRKFCKENVSFDEFVKIYNKFLETEEIEYDEKLYCTENVIRTRKNRLSEARILLWKQNEQIRYYDIDSRDYTELLDVLNLEAYENVEISTLKLINEYPDIMNKYDIRDQYELHNLLRKIIPEGSFNDFHCSRMPDIKFGTPNRNNAIMELLIDNSPIGLQELVELIHKEYGYDHNVIVSSYLQPFYIYFHEGIYSVDYKEMSLTNQQILQKELIEDFYYIDEIREIYSKIIPNADLEEVNSYNLKKMGFIVLSRYVIQNHDSLEAYCKYILTKDDISNITFYKKRMVYIQMFYQTFYELRQNLEVIEFEPNQIIHIRKLERSGISKNDLKNFCEEVYNYIEDETYFSNFSLRYNGFEVDLYELGFSDLFYSNVIVSDGRFSYCSVFNAIIIYKGKCDISVKSFIVDRVTANRSIDVYDLMNELTEVYGCKISDKYDILYKLNETEIYYDKFLDRLYANFDIYYSELDEFEVN